MFFYAQIKKVHKNRLMEAHLRINLYRKSWHECIISENDSTVSIRHERDRVASFIPLTFLFSAPFSIPILLGTVQVGRIGKLVPERSDVECLERLLLSHLLLGQLLQARSGLLCRFGVWNAGSAGWGHVSGRGHFGLQSHSLLFPDALELQLDLLVLGQEVLEGLVNTVVWFESTVSRFPSLVPRLQLF